MRLAAHVGLGLLLACGPRVGADGDGGGSQTDGAATDGMSASSAGSGSGSDGEWVCPTTVAEPPWCYDRIALPGVEWPWAGIPVELGEGRGTGLALVHKAGSDDIWNGGPVSLVAWEDGQLIVTHGDFAHPDVSGRAEDFRAVRLSGNAAEDLIVYNYLGAFGIDHFIELLVLEGDRWVLAESKPVVLPEGFEVVNDALLPRDVDGTPMPLLVELGVGIHRLARGEDAWELTEAVIPLPAGLPAGGLGMARYGDVDGDGREDMLVVFDDVGDGEPERLLLLRGDPASPIGFEVIDVGEYTLSSLDLGDFDGDGRLDILELGGHGPIRFELHRGRGDGSFDPPVSGEMRPSLEGSARVAGDVNGDGKEDLFVTSGFVTSGTELSTSIRVVEHLESGGADGLLSVSTYEVPLATVDLNADGLLEIVLQHGDPSSSLLMSVASVP